MSSEIKLININKKKHKRKIQENHEFMIYFSS